MTLAGISGVSTSPNPIEQDRTANISLASRTSFHTVATVAVSWEC